MKKLIVVLLFSSFTLSSQIDTTKMFDIVCYKPTDSFYIYIINNGGQYHYNFSSTEVVDFSQMFWKSSKSMPIDTTMYKPYLIKRVRVRELHERIAKELK